MSKKSDLEKRLGELESLHAKGILTDEEYAARRTALVSDVAAPTEKKRGGGIFKWGLMGCFGLFAGIGLLVVLLVVVLVAALGNSADTTTDSGGDVRVSLAEGSSGEISPEGNGSKKSKVVILEIKDAAESQNQFEAPGAGKKYWAVHVSVENTGTAEVTSLDWKLRDSKNIESSPAFLSGIGSPLDPGYTLTPGGKNDGWVVFEIASDAKPTWLRADPNPFLAYDLYFDAK